MDNVALYGMSWMNSWHCRWLCVLGGDVGRQVDIQPMEERLHRCVFGCCDCHGVGERQGMGGLGSALAIAKRKTPYKRIHFLYNKRSQDYYYYRRIIFTQQSQYSQRKLENPYIISTIAINISLDPIISTQQISKLSKYIIIKAIYNYIIILIT